jgi:hypothetical protein
VSVVPEIWSPKAKHLSRTWSMNHGGHDRLVFSETESKIVSRLIREAKRVVKTVSDPNFGDVGGLRACYEEAGRSQILREVATVIGNLGKRVRGMFAGARLD